jgi:hypothetical protein
MSTCLVMGDFTLCILPTNTLIANMGDRYGLSVKAPLFCMSSQGFDK